MTPTSPPLSVKTTGSGIQPNTTNESLILLFSQIEAIHETLEALRQDASENKEDMKGIYDRITKIETRLAVEERDKKILLGFVTVVLPILFTILQFFIK